MANSDSIPLTTLLKDRLRIYETDANLVNPFKDELEFFRNIRVRGQYSISDWVTISDILKRIGTTSEDREIRTKAFEDLILFIDNNYNQLRP